MAQKMTEFASKLGGKGLGGGLGAILAATGLFYGATNSIFTGFFY